MLHMVERLIIFCVAISGKILKASVLRESLLSCTCWGSDTCPHAFCTTALRWPGGTAGSTLNAACCTISACELQPTNLTSETNMQPVAVDDVRVVSAAEAFCGERKID